MRETKQITVHKSHFQSKVPQRVFKIIEKSFGLPDSSNLLGVGVTADLAS